MTATIGDGDEAEAAFTAAEFVHTLAVGAAFNGCVLVERPAAHDWHAKSAVHSEVAVAPIIGAEHVGVAVKDGEALDVVGDDEVANFAAFGGESAPMIFAFAGGAA